MKISQRQTVKTLGLGFIALSLNLLSPSSWAADVKGFANQGNLMSMVIVADSTKNLQKNTAGCAAVPAVAGSCTAAVLDTAQIGFGAYAVIANMSAQNAATGKSTDPESLKKLNETQQALQTQCGPTGFDQCLKQKTDEARKLMSQLTSLSNAQNANSELKGLDKEIAKTKKALDKLDALWEMPESPFGNKTASAPLLAEEDEDNREPTSDEGSDPVINDGEDDFGIAGNYVPKSYQPTTWTEALWGLGGDKGLNEIGLFERNARRHQGLIGDRDLKRDEKMARFEKIRKSTQPKTTLAQAVTE